MISPTTRTAPRSSTRTASRVAAALGAAALTAALAACGSPSVDPSVDQPMGSVSGMTRSASPSPSTSAPTPASSAAGEHDSADVTFAQQMIVHHEGAIAMADLAADRAGDQRVKDLASRIRAAQTPEVQQMTGWLQAWGEPAPETSSAASTGSTGSTDHSSGSMDDDGMAGGAMGMSQQQVDQLSAASGTAFDRTFLRMMVVHHQGAIAMSQQELTAGAAPEAKALASSIVTSQTAEVREMQQLLTDLG